MPEYVIPLGLLAFIGLFAYAIVSGARKQRAEKSRAFRELARARELDYEPVDTGPARRFAADFDGIGRFESPSLGDVIPTDVCTGAVDGFDVVVFRHGTRFSEGHAREWFVAGVDAGAHVAERCAVELFDGRVDADSIYLEDGIVRRARIGAYEMLVRAPDESAAGKLLETRVLESLGELARNLPFVPEIQARSSRIAVYPAGRNDEIADAETLERLTAYAVRVAAALA